MVMGRNGYGPKWSWAEMVMGRNDPESIEDVTERTCSHSSSGGLKIRSRIFRLRV